MATVTIPGGAGTPIPISFNISGTVTGVSGDIYLVEGSSILQQTPVSGNETIDPSVFDVKNFSAGEMIVLNGLTEVNASYDPGAGVLTLTAAGPDHQTLSFDVTGTGLNAITDFTVVTAPNYGLTEIVANAPCFGRGTRILTDAGEIAIERLEIGDLVVTASGDKRPIRWIGRRRLDLSSHPYPERVRPVRIAAGALGDDAPTRDLLLSPEHALWLQSSLVPAGELVNGASIRQEAWSTIEYFHIELDDHDILVAEGALAESYLDCDNRRGFDNASDGVTTLHPDWRALAAARQFASAKQIAALREAFAARAATQGRAGEIDAWKSSLRARAQAPRTNFVRNPRAEGSRTGRLGAGGAAPTHWLVMAPEGVAIEILGAGGECDLSYVDIRFVGRAEISGMCSIYAEQGRTAVAEAGQDWTLSAFMRMVGGSMAGVEAVNLYFDENGADGAYLDGQPVAQRLPGTDELDSQRYAATHRLRRRETASMTGYIQIAIAAEKPVDFTLRIAGPQIEMGAYASDLILPPAGLIEVSARQAPAASASHGAASAPFAA